MNLLKQSLGIPTINCALVTDITAAAPDFIVLVGVNTAFFSPATYSEQGYMDSSINY